MRPGMTKQFLLLIAIALFSIGPAQADPWEAITDELDRFAVAHLDKVQALSIRDGVEYCGLFGYDAAGRLSATGPVAGEADSCDPGIEPDGFEVVASYHTHGAYARDADSEVPSLDDLLGDFEEGIDGYIATPGGRVWLNLFEERLAFQLCGRGCIQSDPAFRPCHAFLPAEEYTVESLALREEQDTGEC